MALLDASTLEVTKLDKKNVKRWVSDVKFSPDGASIAVGAHDQKVHMYTSDLKRKLKGKGLSKSSAAITHLDWSADSKPVHLSLRTPGAPGSQSARPGSHDVPRPFPSLDASDGCKPTT